MTPPRQVLLPLLLPLSLLALSACGGDDAVPTGADLPAVVQPGGGAVLAPSAGTPAPSAAPPAAGEPTSVDPAPAPAVAVPTSSPAGAAPRPLPTVSPLALPAGPATPAPAPVVRPGGLSSVAWAGRPLPAGTCAGGTAGAVVLGDLDADGREEAAVPVTCPGEVPDAVLVFTGGADDVVLLGDALPADDRGGLHAVQVRDRHLVVTAFGRSAGTPATAEPDLAVTSRWLVRGGQLERTDRWEDPAEVFVTDAGHAEDGHAEHGE